MFLKETGVVKGRKKLGKIMDSIGKVLNNKVIKNGAGSRVNHEFQANALHIIKQLNVPRFRYSAYFAVCKRENPTLISRAFSFAVDHPNVPARDKMFFWKLNDLKKNTP